VIRADPEALLAAALDYAGRGWRVLPCQPGDKRPHGKLCPHWRHDSSTDPEVITRWWTAEPHANIGLVTGLAFDVLDMTGPRLSTHSNAQARSATPTSKVRLRRHREAGTAT